MLFHIGSSLIGTQVDRRASSSDGDLRPGDGWIVNDPHTAGAMHQGDVSVIMPTFHSDEHLGWSFANMHVLDIGGVGISGYAPGAHDVYQEGLRFPPIRIIRDGAIDSEWEKFIAANVRAARAGAQRHPLDDRGEQHGGAQARRRSSTSTASSATASTARSTRTCPSSVLRERIARIPDGVYEATDWNEFDGHDGPDLLLEMGLRMEVDGERPALRASRACRRSTRSSTRPRAR